MVEILEWKKFGVKTYIRQSERIMRHPGLKKMVSSFEQKSWYAVPWLFRAFFLYQGCFRLSPEKKTVSLNPKEIINTLRKANGWIPKMDGLESQKTPFKHGTNVGISDFRCCMSWLGPPPKRGNAAIIKRQFRRQRDVEALGLHVLLQPGVRPGISELDCCSVGPEESGFFFLTLRIILTLQWKGYQTWQPAKWCFLVLKIGKGLKEGSGSLGH